VRRRAETVAAVDFGSREIRALIARREPEGAIRILGHGRAPSNGCVSQGVIQDLSAARVAFKSALGEAEREARQRVMSVFCGINGRNVETFIREGQVRIDDEVVEGGHMDEARDVASRDILAPGRHITSSVSAQEWFVDDLRVIEPLGIHGQVLKMRVHFARMPSVIHDNVASCLEQLNRELEDVIFLPVASALGCLTPEDMELGVAVLDMGRATTGLAVYRGRSILGSHCFEWGGNHLTRDVAAGLRISFEEADELIQEYGISDECIREGESDTGEDDAAVAVGKGRGPSNSIKLKTAVPGAPTLVDRSELDSIVYQRARELLVKVRQHLQSRGLAKHLVRGVVLTGGAGAIHNYVQLAESIFQVPCRLGLPNSVEIVPQAAKGPEFTAAVGIVRHGFEYRSAARHGRAEAKGPLVSSYRRFLRFLRRYFF
jgi:cell division protein FtsA